MERARQKTCPPKQGLVVTKPEVLASAWVLRLRSPALPCSAPGQASGAAPFPSQLFREDLPYQGEPANPKGIESLQPQPQAFLPWTTPFRTGRDGTVRCTAFYQQEGPGRGWRRGLQSARGPASQTHKFSGATFPSFTLRKWRFPRSASRLERGVAQGPEMWV